MGSVWPFLHIRSSLTRNICRSPEPQEGSRWRCGSRRTWTVLKRDSHIDLSARAEDRELRADTLTLDLAVLEDGLVPHETPNRDPRALEQQGVPSRLCRGHGPSAGDSACAKRVVYGTIGRRRSEQTRPGWCSVVPGP
jgi:hypothetical protein